MWRSPVARLVRDEEVVGSNPAIPTTRPLDSGRGGAFRVGRPAVGIMHVVYVLESERTKRLYVGQSSDLQRRLREHRAGRVRSTRGRGPWRLLHAEPVASRAEAVRLERWLKAQKSSRSVRAWIAAPR